MKTQQKFRKKTNLVKLQRLRLKMHGNKYSFRSNYISSELTAQFMFVGFDQFSIFFQAIALAVAAVVPPMAIGSAAAVAAAASAVFDAWYPFQLRVQTKSR